MGDVCCSVHGVVRDLHIDMVSVPDQIQISDVHQFKPVLHSVRRHILQNVGDVLHHVGTNGRVEEEVKLNIGWKVPVNEYSQI